jgi:hypothetical protein
MAGVVAPLGRVRFPTPGTDTPISLEFPYRFPPYRWEPLEPVTGLRFPEPVGTAGNRCLFDRRSPPVFLGPPTPPGAQTPLAARVSRLRPGPRRFSDVPLVAQWRPDVAPTTGSGVAAPRDPPQLGHLNNREIHLYFDREFPPRRPVEPSVSSRCVSASFWVAILSP